ncbi:MAG TPA: hypothetical protein VHG28_06095 [Longimicrobiaceae bacterium]|nr:hypothetical protein [Longimicrobiaceae bacterium]
MHLILPNSVFVHIPKTGGTWVRKALTAAQIPWSRTALLPHADFSHLEPLVEGRFTFAFVRHPLSWYRSAWSYRMSNPERLGPASMAEFWSEDFDTFVTGCCSYRSGLLTELFERFTGWPVKLDWTGHAERLADGLVEALTLAGESFDPAAIHGCPPANVSPSRFTESAVYCDQTRELLLRAEEGVISRYGYDALPGRLVAADAVA